MNSVNMANMGAIAAGAVGTPMNMVNNVAGPGQGTPRQMQPSDNIRAQLNTYIYEYFIRNNMYECARVILHCDTPPKVQKDSGGSRRDENGNLLGNGLSDDPMDTDSKDGLDSKRPEDLPAPLDNCFLYEWFCIFWDIANAQKGKGSSPQVNQYVQHTQQQSRMRQEQQQHMLRQMNPNFSQAQYQQQMMRMQNTAMGMAMKQPGNNLQRAAMANNQNPQMQMLQQKPGQMPQNPDMDGNRARPASPGSTDNAPSPSKRPRLDGGAFNPNQQGVMMPNGRPPQGMPGQQQVYQNPAVTAKTIATYAANLQQHHGNQMPNKPMPNAGVPQGQGSPMVPQGPDGAGIGAFYNAGDMAPGNMRPGPGNGQPGNGTGNHALQDYQMQLMLLEQQNKKRLMMARQEQDMGTAMPRTDGPGGPGVPVGPGGAPPGPNGQGFQGTSPPGGRPGPSPNPTEQMKRANQQLGNAANMGSPLPEGVAPSRSSPNPMNFMGNLAEPAQAPHFFAMNGGGMRPPNAHPGQPFNAQMSQQQQQQMMARQAQQGQGGPGMQWQGGPNGGQMPPGAQPQVQGTPQQRSMPPPSAPAANANARNATSSPQTSTAAPPTPQQGNKAAPKKKESKSAKNKTAAQKKSNSNLNAGATPAAEPAPEQEPPTPATPITPVNPASFAKQGQNAGAVVVNGQATAQPPPAAAPVVPPHTDPAPNSGFTMDSTGGIDFSVGGMDFVSNPLATTDVLNDFDFDSFLHDNTGGDDGSFDFGNPSFSMEGGEIGAE